MAPNPLSARRRLAQMGSFPESGQFVPHRDDDTQQIDFAIPSAPIEDHHPWCDRITVRTWWDERGLTDYFIAHEIENPITGQKHTVAYVDTCHGSVHLHRCTPSDPEGSKSPWNIPFKTRQEVQDSKQEAIEWMEKRREDNLRRWFTN